ncbi:unnamed protein product [Arctogadus glacialis]
MGFRSENTLRPERGHLKRSDGCFHASKAAALPSAGPAPAGHAPLTTPPLATPSLAPPQVPVLVKRGLTRPVLHQTGSGITGDSWGLKTSRPCKHLKNILQHTTHGRSKVPHRLSNIKSSGHGPDHTGTAPHSSSVFPLQPSPETSSPSDHIPLTRVFSVVEVL